MAQKKFKKWLVRKLGGYPDLPVRMPDIRKEQVNLVRLMAVKNYPIDHVKMCGITNEDMIKDTFVEVELCRKLAWELAPYVNWKMIGHDDGKVEFVANVCVARGKGEGINIYFKEQNGRKY